MQFDRSHRPSYGVLESVAPRLRRMTANNPSPFTYLGTETYVIGEGEVAVVDPGPADPKHINDLLIALKSETITHILLTHTHADHCSGCELLQQSIAAPVIGYQLESTDTHHEDTDSDEAVDTAFRVDEIVHPGESIAGRDWALECLYTPGHMLNHLCFSIAGENALLSGDHVMGWSTSIVSPPEGHMGSYVKSLEFMLTRDEQTYWPGHGGPVRNPHQYVKSLIEHRKLRERLVLNTMANGSCSVAEMVPIVYAEIDNNLYPAAARSLYATVIDLVEQGHVQPEGTISIDTVFHLA